MRAAEQRVVCGGVRSVPEGIFVIQADGKLRELTEQPYDSEDLLQRLLADYPDLLAGKQMDPATPRRWLLVTREAPVPGEDGGAGRWSVDHLFLDQEGTPTLVEVKRSTDTRIRREVVGQMLDYAANGVAYWPAESLQGLFNDNCVRAGRDGSAVLAEFLGPDGDPASFFSELGQRMGEAAAAGGRAVLDWARARQIEPWWGKGLKDGSFVLWLEGSKAQHWLVACYTYGRMEILFQYMQKGPFADPSKREELRQRLNDIAGFEVPPDALARRPRIPLEILSEKATQEALFAVLDWEVAEARAWEEGEARQ